MKRSIELGHVQETLLIPLYERAVETRKRDGLLRDPRAVEMVETIDYDFRRFDDAGMLLGTVLRTAIFDEMVRAFITQHPGATVIEIGAGLNTRFERLDNGRLRWIDLDLPDSMRLRRQFFADTARRRMVASSVLEHSWIDVVKKNPRPYFMTAEAVFAYLPEHQVKRALGLIAEHFPGARVAFDTAGRQILDAQCRGKVVKGMRARFAWACDDPREVEQWGLGYRLLESRSFADLPLSLDYRLPFSYRYWIAVARLLGREEIEAYRVNLYGVGNR